MPAEGFSAYARDPCGPTALGSRQLDQLPARRSRAAASELGSQLGPLDLHRQLGGLLALKLEGCGCAP